MKVGEIIAKQLEKLGIDTTTEDLKPVLGITVEVPEVITGKLDTLITLHEAKNNGDIKDHYLKNFIKGTDQALDEKLKKLGLGQEQIDEIFKNDKFGKRIENALEKLSEAKEGQAKAKKAGDVDTEKVYKDQIEKLNKDLSEYKDSSKRERDILIENFENEKIGDEVGREFLTKPWSNAYPDDVKDKLVIANVHLQNKLQQIGGKLVRDKETKLIKIVDAKNPEMDLFVSNKTVTLASLVSEIGTDKKLFAVSTPIGQGAEQKIVGGQQPQGAPRTNNATLNALWESQRDQAQNFPQ